MNKAIDIELIYGNIRSDYYLKIAYRYKFYEFLVSDKYGNLFVLDHCPNKRTIKFNQLEVFENNKHLQKNKRSNSVKYHGSIISFKQLKECSYSTDELYLIPLNHKLISTKNPRQN